MPVVPSLFYARFTYLWATKSGDLIGIDALVDGHDAEDYRHRRSDFPVPSSFPP